MKSGIFPLCLLLLVPLRVIAQTPDPATRELVDKLLARIDSLEKRVILGEREQALDRLQSSFDDRSPGLVFLKVDPVFDAFRPDPRFTALMHRMGL